ncbi:MAG: AraC family transcriptional regulator [Leptospiraceae bacterium]|nr:AraC family transcriptional regulator [Leptospiraceae bacterium]
MMAALSDTSVPEELISLSVEYSRPGALNETPLGELKIIRSDMVSGPIHSIYEPSVCFVVQGAKNATVGNQTYRCEPGRFFASSANLPAVGEVIQASPEKPYIALILSIGSGAIYEIISELDLRPESGLERAGVFTDEVSPPMTDAFLRLMRTLPRALDRQFMAPMIMKEIIYYLLQSRYSRVLYEFGIQGSNVNRLSRSIQKIRTDFSSPLKVDALARLADMSPSAFYNNFKKLTGLSPIQFQKQLRLQEARKLLATEVNDITSVAYNVGYESPSQFSRDYSRLFGLSPSRDLRNLRNPANAFL